MRSFIALIVAVHGLVLASALASAQTFGSGSTGADGAFSPTVNTTLTLPADGVFNFTTISIPSNVTVKFARNAANTPVTLLASGNVTIAGTIDISGGAGGAALFSGTSIGGNGGPGGPGGSDGGAGATGLASTTGGSGLGLGGGSGSTGSAIAGGGGGGGGGYVQAGATGTGPGVGAGGSAYGSPSLLPLIGGSGDGGGGGVLGTTGGGGGGGGGAILIATSGTMTLTSTGRILAQGGATVTFSGLGLGNGGGGSGGAVRLVATAIGGSGGQISIAGGSAGTGAGAGSPGRARIEAFTNTLSANLGTPPAAAVSSGPPTSVALPNGPVLRIASVAGVAAPATPTASFSNPDIVLPGGTTSPVAVTLAASNIPLGTSISVTAKGLNGAAGPTASVPLTGTLESSTATTSVVIPTNEPSVLSASATFTVAALDRGPLFADGEEIERIRLTASPGGPAQIVFITGSGREITRTTR
jgi:hypothetical protein